MSATHTYYIENASGSRRYYSTSDSNPINREAHEVHLSPASNHPVRVSSHSPRQIRSSVRLSSRSPVSIRTSVHTGTYIVPTRISYAASRPVRSFYTQRVHVTPYHSSYIPSSRHIVDSYTYERFRSSSRNSRISCARQLAPINEKYEEIFENSARMGSETDTLNNKEQSNYLEPPMKFNKYDEGEVSTDSEEEFDQLKKKIEQANIIEKKNSEEKKIEDEGTLKIMKNAVSMKLKNWLRTNTAQAKIFSEEESKQIVNNDEKKQIEENLKGEDFKEDNESVVSFCYSINDQPPVRVFRKNSRNASPIRSSESMYQF